MGCASRNTSCVCAYTYMKLMDVPIGLLINFHAKYLKVGLMRMVLRGANLEDVDFIA